VGGGNGDEDAYAGVGGCLLNANAGVVEGCWGARAYGVTQGPGAIVQSSQPKKKRNNTRRPSTLVKPPAMAMAGMIDRPFPFPFAFRGARP
jgi:hypothetical protein